MQIGNFQHRKHNALSWCLFIYKETALTSFPHGKMHCKMQVYSDLMWDVTSRPLYTTLYTSMALQSVGNQLQLADAASIVQQFPQSPEIATHLWVFVIVALLGSDPLPYQLIPDSVSYGPVEVPLGGYMSILH